MHSSATFQQQPNIIALGWVYTLAVCEPHRSCKPSSSFSFLPAFPKQQSQEKCDPEKTPRAKSKIIIIKIKTLSLSINSTSELALPAVPPQLSYPTSPLLCLNQHYTVLKPYLTFQDSISSFHAFFPQAM